MFKRAEVKYHWQLHLHYLLSFGEHFVNKEMKSNDGDFLWLQLALLLAVFSIEAYVRLRLVHPMLRAKHVKTQMEETAGGGQEVTIFFIKTSSRIHPGLSSKSPDPLIFSKGPHPSLFPPRKGGNYKK